MPRNNSGFARGRAKLATVVVAVGAMAAALLAPGAANAVDNSEPSGLVSFTFDDGSLSSLTEAAPTLQEHGLTGTNYVVTNCVGMTTVPNSCRANNDVPYMTWAEIKQLQTQYGWEIGSHGVDHQCLASTGDDCQPNQLTAAQIDAQMADSRSALAAQGINATAFAPPYGDYDQTVLAKVAKYYSSMRGFRDEGVNLWPLSDYLVNNVAVEEGLDTVATLKAKVDEAIAAKTWVVFTFHDIVPTPSTDPDDYQFGSAELDELAAYVETKVTAGQIKNVNVSKGLVTGTPNKMPNASFNSGIGEGWRTDAPATITADANGNGSYPDPTRSVKLVSGATTTHLFSPQVAVTPGTNYLYKNFLNVSALTSGEVAFYVDEYNAAGAWVSGQYRAREPSRWVEELNFTYTPSSSNVAKASLQVIVLGTGITAYLDNVELLALGAETPPPPAANLVANGTFDAGISGGWSTDAATAIVADSTGNGAPANPAKSVKLQGTTANGHLFSPRVNVTPGNYNISAYLKIQNRTAGEVGWYIDEYDANGNWISGQWKLASTALGVSNVDLTYSPSTTSVATASLQVYVTGNSGVLAYVDDVRWWRP
ncbi:polysaccharide deacetylase family protein [Cryobacterium sp. N22]|uniref:polysaccharide deacetylase family protein n=1 Tax=Cryobacterium sp. N22 TaxID=2048290 RepID=UPI000CE47447|nr:polysaccharide deacetylase family protein [Cryobacterium sp. N22]